MVNREHKDRLFCFLFGREEHKQWTLSLYNAVNHTAYTNPDDLRITTMSDVLYMGMKNDCSFLIFSNEVNFYEQQASLNPNMPLRKLMYAGKYYDKYVHENSLNIYGTELVPLPVPKLVTFYNGKTNAEDEVILELKDAFLASWKAGTGNNMTAFPEPDINVRVRMLNINYGHNKELLKACKPLAEYSWLVGQIRRNNATMPIEKAVNKALDDMPKNYVIRKCLIGNRAEVMDMCLTEYDEEETMRLFEEDGRRKGREEGLKEGLKEGHKAGLKAGHRAGLKEGRAEGLKKGREEGFSKGREAATLETILSFVRDGLVTLAVGAQRAGMDEAEFAKLLKS